MCPWVYYALLQTSQRVFQMLHAVFGNQCLQVDEDLAEETGDEAKKYGKIEEVKVMEATTAWVSGSGIACFTRFTRPTLPHG